MLLSVSRELLAPPVSLPPAKQAADPEVREAVWNVLSELYPSGKAYERRRERRFPFPQLIHLSSNQETMPLAKRIVVVGKHLSERGLGFFHRDPLSERQMVATFERAGGLWNSFLIDLSWCRFTRHGWYESGGRLLQLLPPCPPDGAR